MSTNAPQERTATPEAAKVTTNYCCVNCMAILSDNGPDELCCRQCGRSFPVISHIPVLTSRPRELLMVHLQEFRQAQTALEKRRSLLHEPAKDPGGLGAAQRVQRMLQGMAQNLGLIELFMKPIEEYLSKNQQASTLIDWALAQSAGSVPQ